MCPRYLHIELLPRRAMDYVSTRRTLSANIGTYSNTSPPTSRRSLGTVFRYPCFAEPLLARRGFRNTNPGLLPRQLPVSRHPLGTSTSGRSVAVLPISRETVAATLTACRMARPGAASFSWRSPSEAATEGSEVPCVRRLPRGRLRKRRVVMVWYVSVGRSSASHSVLPSPGMEVCVRSLLANRDCDATTV